MNGTDQSVWDYGSLAATYDLRPDYCAGLVAEILQTHALDHGQWALEVGAGTGKLTRLLLNHGLNVLALEPNKPMQSVAMNKPEVRKAHWLSARGEALPVHSACMDLVAFGSSFNVLPVQQALDECARVLRPGGVWLAMWNHRDLNDPLQSAIEAVIRRQLPSYDYGRRRLSPEADVARHGAFSTAITTQRGFEVEVNANDWMNAWKSHATLARQAGERLPAILRELSELLGAAPTVRIPYFTRAWSARRTVA